MPSHDYYFVTHWRVHGRRPAVFEILKEGEQYARWWRPAYQETRRVGERKVLATVRARLPYTLQFTTELVRESPDRELEIRASGELVGTGLWKLEQQGPEVCIEFHWQVRAEKPLVRWLSPFLKPLFRWNHDWVMATGERALQAEVDRRQLNVPSS